MASPRRRSVRPRQETNSLSIPKLLAGSWLDRVPRAESLRVSRRARRNWACKRYGLYACRLVLISFCQVDIFYLHAPDASIPISETLAGINEAYKSGAFERFGLSNYKAEDVEKVYTHCKENRYVLPSAYQGNYSPVARLQETLLFPTLRKYGMSFYAYSPLAGGFLTKTKQQILDGAGRFNPNEPIGKMYSGMYNKPSYLEALETWDATAKEAGCSAADLAYRYEHIDPQAMLYQI